MTFPHESARTLPALPNAGDLDALPHSVLSWQRFALNNLQVQVVSVTRSVIRTVLRKAPRDYSNWPELP